MVESLNHVFVLFYFRQLELSKKTRQQNKIVDLKKSTAKCRNRIQRIRKGHASPQAQINKQSSNANLRNSLLFHPLKNSRVITRKIPPLTVGRKVLETVWHLSVCQQIPKEAATQNRLCPAKIRFFYIHDDYSKAISGVTTGKRLTITRAKKRCRRGKFLSENVDSTTSYSPFLCCPSLAGSLEKAIPTLCQYPCSVCELWPLNNRCM